MGSSGRGEFGNYKVDRKSGGIGGIGSGNNDSTLDMECPESIENILLEDISTCEYFKTLNALPNVGQDVYVSSFVFDGRIVVVDTATTKVIGNVPTRYNYLIECISSINYIGTIEISGLIPIPHIVVEIHAK